LSKVQQQQQSKSKTPSENQSPVHKGWTLLGMAKDTITIFYARMLSFDK